MTKKLKRGWLCPRCEQVNAPWREQCDCMPFPPNLLKRIVVPAGDPLYFGSESFNPMGYPYQTDSAESGGTATP